MNELKPCPFCGGKAEIGANEYYDGANTFFVYCTKCKMQMNTKIDTGEAISAWNNRAEQPNKSLTLEELKQMDGEPVWIEIYGKGNWYQFAYQENDKIIAFWQFGCEVEEYFKVSDYNKTWLAYRRPPKGAEQ